MEKNEKRKLVIFASITFLLTVLMGILMGYQYKKGIDISIFALLQMYYPAIGVIISTWIVDKEKDIPKTFYGGLLVLILILFGYCFINVFIEFNNQELHFNIIVSIGSFILWILLISEKNTARESVGINFKNGILSRNIIIIFVAFLIIRQLIIGDGLSDFTLLFIYIFLLMPINFLFSYTAFFGEEYGWRYFLQPILQKQFGKRKGVLLLGVIWGIWHLPLNLFYYSPETWVQSVVIQLGLCISLGVFFGYAYIKTNNIWVPIMLHFINNNLLAVVTQSDFSNQIITWEEVLITTIFNFIIFVPFIFTKEYSDTKESTFYTK
ncbi:MAG: lysostaphin resistance A-like protein [Aminipila sp.]